MQSISRTGSGGLSQQARRIATMAIVLFALSGLISGFAVGAFVKPKLGNTAQNTGNGNTTVTQKTRTPVPVTPVKDLPLAEPDIVTYSPFAIADGSTTYTLSAKILEKNTNKPVQTSDVTCKMFLTKDGDVNDFLRANNYAVLKAITSIQQPFANEVPDSLNFVAPSQQTQFCTPNGLTSWTYTVSPSVKQGLYYLVVLADWMGKRFNWYTVEVRIKKAN